MSLYPIGEVIPIPSDLTHLHPECFARMLDDFTWRMESASDLGTYQDVSLDEFGNPILCTCLYWQKRTDDSFRWCWHVKRAKWYADQVYQEREKQAPKPLDSLKRTSMLNGPAGLRTEDFPFPPRSGILAKRRE